jgi:fatty-acyl-CoA synthase
MQSQWAPLTIGSILDACVRAKPSGVAATLADQSRTFLELDAAGNRCAHTLREFGVGPGDFVAWWAGPSLRTLDGFIGAARAGAVFAPFNPELPPVEAAAILAYSQPRLVVVDQPHAEVAVEICRDLGLPLAVMGGVTPPAGPFATHIGQGPVIDFDAACARASRAPVGLWVDDATPHILYLTSGSTGQPKGALVSHRASWLRATPGGGTFVTGIRGTGGVVTAFPLYHYGGWHYVLESWLNRRPFHIAGSADAESIIAEVERWQVTALYAIPAVWERILDATEHDHRLGSLNHADTGTSRTSDTLIARIKGRLPATTTTVLYGSTEAGRMAALRDDQVVDRPGSVGQPASPGILWIEDGEICCASPALMDGYLDRPAETAAVLGDGYYRSGDVGYFDDEGYLYITGRTRELIRSGGENVWPTEVEAALRGLPDVLDLAVVGLPDDRWGELVCAVFVMADGADIPDTATVRRHVEHRLARHKLPRVIRATSAIPRTPATGQVRRGVLVETLGANVSVGSTVHTGRSL